MFVYHMCSYNELVTLDNLFSAWYEFRLGKQHKPDVLLFERHLEDELFQLYDELITKTYRHQGYYTFHIYDPKFRIINKATVRDRVVHHLLFRFLEPIFQPMFIHHSYACQKGKGIHKGVTDVHVALRRVSRNNMRTIWALKLDIKQFFASVDHEILLALVQRKVYDPRIMQLIEIIVRSFHSDQGAGKGVPIGNLTSQIFANIYLSELDYFVKRTLRERYYFRYADDFLFLHPDKSHLEQICLKVDEFVRERLKLTLHPRKIILRKYNQGIDWLGYVLLPHYRVLRTRTKQRMFKKMMDRVAEYNNGERTNDGLDQCLQSYVGMLGHCAGCTIEKKLRNEVWLKSKIN